MVTVIFQTLVRSHVCFIMSITIKSLSANFTIVAELPCVYLGMSFEASFCSESLITFGARINLSRSCLLLLCLQITAQTA